VTLVKPITQRCRIGVETISGTAGGSACVVVCVDVTRVELDVIQPGSHKLAEYDL